MSAQPEDILVRTLPRERGQASPWRHALPALLLLVVAILLLYWGSAAAMVAIWMRSETFAHALLVPPISLWLIWRQRDRLAAMTPRVQPWVLVPLLAVAFAWLISDLAVVNAATQFALVTLLVLAVPAVLGLQVAGTILFPLMFLFFAVPFGEFMQAPMMDWTADFTVAALQLTGIPVYREGLHFVIPSGRWSVIEACSGVRYLIASFMVGTLFAYLNYRSTRRRVIFMAVSIVLPIVANWLRAYMIVMLGHLSGNTIAVGVDHLIYGWVFFGVVIMAMFWMGAKWSEPDEPVAGTTDDSVAGPAGSTTVHRFTASPAAIGGTLLVALAIVALPQVVRHRLAAAEATAGEPRLELPSRLSNAWASDGAAIIDWAPSFEPPSTKAQAAYTAGPGRTVGLYLGYYRKQEQKKKLVSSQNFLVASFDRTWNLLSTDRHSLTIDGRAINLRSASVLRHQAAGETTRTRLTVWHLYWIDGRWVDRDASAKLHGAWARLLGRGDEGASVVVYVQGESNSAATATLEAFMADNADAIDTLLQRTRDAR